MFDLSSAVTAVCFTYVCGAIAFYDTTADRSAIVEIVRNDIESIAKVTTYDADLIELSEYVKGESF